MLTNTPLADAVIANLDLDPRIPDAAEIAVSCDGATVTLRGTVKRFSQRRAAVRAALDTDGVYQVDDQLKVRLIGADRREDDEIRGVALQALIWDTEIPADSVEVKVKDGWITLTGDVSHQFQSDAAYDDVARLYGVAGVTNAIKVSS